MTRLLTETFGVVNSSGYKATTDVRSITGATAPLNGKGAGDAQFLLTGVVKVGSSHPADYYNGLFRSVLIFDIDGFDWSAVKVIRQAYVSVWTRFVEAPDPVTYPYVGSYFITGSDAKLRIHRLTANATFAHNGDGKIDDPAGAPGTSHWNTGDYSDITSSDWNSKHYDEFVSPNNKGETRVRCTQLMGEWAPAEAGGHKLYYYNPNSGANLVQCGDPAHWADTHAAFANKGIVMRAPNETVAGGDLRAEFYSPRAATSRIRPHLVMIYEPWDPAPAIPRIIHPKGSVKPHFRFEGYIPEPDPDDPISEVEIVVRDDVDGGGSIIWHPTVGTSRGWQDGEFSIENPRQPTLPANQDLSWRVQSASAAGIVSGFTGWQNFTIQRVSPIVTPQEIGDQVQLVGTRLRAPWTTP